MNKEKHPVCGDCYQMRVCEAERTVSTHGLERGRVTPAHSVGDCFLHVCSEGYDDAVEMLQHSFAQALSLFGSEHKPPLLEGPVLGRMVVKRDFGRFNKGDVVVYMKNGKEEKMVKTTNIGDHDPRKM